MIERKLKALSSTPRVSLAPFGDFTEEGRDALARILRRVIERNRVQAAPALPPLTMRSSTSPADSVRIDDHSTGDVCSQDGHR